MVLLLLVVGEPTTGLDQGSTQRPSPHPCQQRYELPDLTFNLISHQPDWQLLTQLLCPSRAFSHPFFFSLPSPCTRFASASHCPLAPLRSNTTPWWWRQQWWKNWGLLSEQPWGRITPPLSHSSPSVSPPSAFFWGGDHTDVPNHIQAVWLWWAHLHTECKLTICQQLKWVWLWPSTNLCLRQGPQEPKLKLLT